MLILKKLALSVTAILLLGSIPAAVLLATLNLTVLKPYNTLQYFEQSGIYEKMSVQIKKTIVEDAVSRSPRIMQKYVAAIMEAASDATVTPQWLQVKTQLVQKTVWDFLTGKSERLEPIPVPELRQSALQAAKRQLNRLPQAVWLLPGMNKERFAMDFAGQIPKQITIEEALDNRVQMQVVKEKYKLFQLESKVFYVFLVILLLIFGWSAGSFKQMLRLFGRLFTTAGFLSLLAAGGLWYGRKLLPVLPPFKDGSAAREAMIHAGDAVLREMVQYAGGLAMAVVFFGLIGLWFGKSRI